jgi:membrane fusion protein (multidrug efflux system)
MAQSGTNKSKWRKVAISLLIVAAASAVVVSVARIPARMDEVAEKEVIPVNVEVLPVEVIPVMADTLELPGHLEPNRSTEVPVEQAGSIQEILCKEGQHVEVGDTLLRLDKTLLAAEYDRAEAQAVLDRQTLNRTVELVERGVLNRSQLEEAQARSIVSNAVLKLAQTNLERTTLRSPASGLLNDLLKEEGEYVSPGDAVAQIVQIDTLKAVLEIPERDIRYVKPGTPIEVSVDSLDGLQLKGRVTFVSGVADALTRTTRVEVSLSNRRGVLHSGMIVRARIPRRQLRNVIMIPLAAVVPLEDGRAVYLLSGDRAERREVVLGMTKGSQVQVTEGLVPGEFLIVSGHRQVGPGQIVNRTN